MVEISVINIRRSSICWRGRRGTDNGRQKTRNHGYDVIVGGELFTVTPFTPRKLVTLNPKKLNQQARTLRLLSVVVGCLPQAAAQKDFLRKVGDALWHCNRLRSVALYL